MLTMVPKLAAISKLVDLYYQRTNINQFSDDIGLHFISQIINRFVVK